MIWERKQLLGYPGIDGLGVMEEKATYLAVCVIRLNEETAVSRSHPDSVVGDAFVHQINIYKDV